MPSTPQIVVLALVVIAFVMELAARMSQTAVVADGTIDASPMPPEPAPPRARMFPDHDAAAWDLFFRAIAYMESRGEADPDATYLEDSTARGRYGITEGFWIEAEIPGKHTMCHDDAYARETCRKYYRRYARTAFESRDWHALARLHRKGPGGMHSQTAHHYANTVVALMKGGLQRHKSVVD